jgi:hypothetical protein
MVLPSYDNFSWYHPFNWVQGLWPQLVGFALLWQCLMISSISLGFRGFGTQLVVLPCYDNLSGSHPFYRVLGFKGVWLVVFFFFFCLGLWTTGQTQRDKHKEPKDHENTDCRQSFLNCYFCKGRKRKQDFACFDWQSPPYVMKSLGEVGC